MSSKNGVVSSKKEMEDSNILDIATLIQEDEKKNTKLRSPSPTFGNVDKTNLRKTLRTVSRTKGACPTRIVRKRSQIGFSDPISLDLTSNISSRPKS